MKENGLNNDLVGWLDRGGESDENVSFSVGSGCGALSESETSTLSPSTSVVEAFCVPCEDDREYTVDEPQCKQGRKMLSLESHDIDQPVITMMVPPRQPPTAWQLLYIDVCIVHSMLLPYRLYFISSRYFVRICVRVRVHVML